MGQNTTAEREYLSTRQLADQVGISKVTLQMWRSEGRGPAHFKLGRRVLYAWRDVEEWLKAHRRGGAA